MYANTPHENPFQKLIKVLFFIACGAIVVLSLKGCAAKPIESTDTHYNLIGKSTDSIMFMRVNQEISDSLKIKLDKVKTAKPECDSIAQATLNQVLKQLNSHKKSGDNEAGIYFDELKNQIIYWQKIAETMNQKLAINKGYIHITADKKIIEVPVKYIPWWVEILAYAGAVFILGIVVYAVYKVRTFSARWA